MEEQEFNVDATLPALITRAASRQTYYTIRFLADHDRVSDAYRAYAYFRWVDDWLDRATLEKAERIAFVKRQQALVDCCYQARWPCDLAAEERILVDLIRSDKEQNSGLQSYVRNLMAVMVFDAQRRGRLIAQEELAEYSRRLSTAVTEALHFFIGHPDYSPSSEARYAAVTAAHITHMLRDTFEDITAGYFNIPCEFLRFYGIDPCDVGSDGYRLWVKSRVRLARDYFKVGQRYLARVKNLRCRLAGYAYMARFQGVLEAIERDDYWLRPEYQECRGLRTGLRMCRAVVSASRAFDFSSWSPSQR